MNRALHEHCDEVQSQIISTRSNVNVTLGYGGNDFENRKVWDVPERMNMKQRGIARTFTMLMHLWRKWIPDNGSRLREGDYQFIIAVSLVEVSKVECLQFSLYGILSCVYCLFFVGVVCCCWNVRISGHWHQSFDRFLTRLSLNSSRVHMCFTGHYFFFFLFMSWPFISLKFCLNVWVVLEGIWSEIQPSANVYLSKSLKCQTKWCFQVYCQC